MTAVPETKQKLDLLVWDCDPGCDDALAIAWMLQPGKCPYSKIDFLSVTGNVHVEQTTANTKRVVSACLAGLKGNAPKCRVFRGMSRSLAGDEPSASSVHGRDGLGGVPNNLPGCSIGEKPVVMRTSALERYLCLARRETPFHLLCTGPLTNLAVALSLMNQRQLQLFWSNCKKAVFMGGNFLSHGNITRSAEFNFHADPVAAQMLLTFHREARKKCETVPDLEFIPLDITQEVGIDVDGNNGQPATPAGGLLRYALKEYGTFHSLSAARPKNVAQFKLKESKEHAVAQLLGSGGVKQLKRFCHLHDPVAAWVMVEEPQDLDWKTAEIRIETGMGDSRGRVIDCRRKEGLPFPHADTGTFVRWLTGHEKNRKAIIGSEDNGLIPELRRLVGFE